MWIIEKLSTFYLKYFCVGQSFKTLKKENFFVGKQDFFTILKNDAILLDKKVGGVI